MTLSSDLERKGISDFLALERKGSSITQSYMIPDLILDLERWFCHENNQKIKRYHSVSSKITWKSWYNHLKIMIKSVIFSNIWKKRRVKSLKLGFNQYVILQYGWLSHCWFSMVFNTSQKVCPEFHSGYLQWCLN